MATIKQAYDIHENNEEQKAALTYIQRLASMTNANIVRWNITSIFKKEDGGDEEVITDPRQINKKFFEKYESLLNPQQVVKNTQASCIAGLEDALKETGKNKFDARKNELRRNLTMNKRHANDAFNNAEHYLQRIARIQQELMTLINADDSDYISLITQKINNVLNEGCWVNPVVDGSFLYLNTANDVVISYVNPQNSAIA